MSQNVEGFGKLLLSMQSKGSFSLNVEKANITLGSHGEMNFFKNCTFNINSANPQEIFNDTFREPLKKLYKESGYTQPILIIIDALDEESPGYESISSMLASFANDPDLPKLFHIIITTRPENRVLRYFPNSNSNFKYCDLIDDIPVNIDDINEYVKKKLEWVKLDTKISNDLAYKISESSKGNFLYCVLLVHDLIQRLPEISSILENELPEGLAGLYNEFLNRIFGANANEWNNIYSDLFGLIAIQQGEGFTGLLLKKMVKYINKDHNVKAELETVKQFIDGNFDNFPGEGIPQGPFQIFHKSFIDFLLDEENNKSYHIDTLKIHKIVIDYCLANIQQINDNNLDWNNKEDYFLKYMAYHLSEIIELSICEKNKKTARDSIIYYKEQEQKYLQFLYQLSRSNTYKKSLYERFSDKDLVLAVIQHAISAAATSDDASAIAEFMIMHTDIVSETRRYSPLEEFIKTLDLKNALRVADLYDIQTSSLWYLLLAWELADRGNIEDVKKTLHILSKKDIVTIDSNLLPVHFIILISIYNIDKSVVDSLFRKLFKNRTLLLLFDLIKDEYNKNSIDVPLSDLNIETHFINIINIIAQALTKVDPVRAEELFDRAIKIAEDGSIGFDKPKVMCTIAQALTKIDPVRAEELFDRAIKTSEDLGPPHQSRALGTIAQALTKIDLVRIDLLDKAIIVAEKISDPKYQSSALGTIAQALTKIDPVRAEELFDRSIKIAENTSNVGYKSNALGTIAQALTKIDLVRIDLLDKAIIVAEKISDPDHQSNALGTIAQALTKIDPVRAEELFNRIIKIAEDGTTSRQLENLVTIAQALTKIDPVRAEGLFNKAIKISEELLHRDRISKTSEIIIETTKSSTLETIVQALTKVDPVRIDLLDKAIIVAEHISEELDISMELGTIAQALTKVDPVRAEGLFNRIIKIADNMSNVGYKSNALGTIAQALTKMDNNKARKIINGLLTKNETLLHYSNKSKAFNNLADTLSEIDPVRAVNLWDKAIIVAEKISDPKYQSSALGTIAQALTKVDPVRAEGLFNRIIKIAEDLSSDDQSSALGTIAQALTKVDPVRAEGLFNRIIKIAEDSSDVGYKSKALGTIAQALTKVDPVRAEELLNRAIKIAENMSKKLDRLKALGTIAQALTKVDPVRAEELLNRAIKIAENMSKKLDRLDRLKALETIAQALTKIDPVRAEELFNKIIKIAENTSNVGYKSNALGTIAQALIETNPARIDLLDKAITIAEKISDPNHQSSALGTIAQALTKIDPVRAEELFNRIIKIAEDLSPDDQPNAFGTISQALTKIDPVRAEGLLVRAIKIAELDIGFKQSNALGTIAQALTKIDPVRAEGLFNKIIKIAESSEVAESIDSFWYDLALQGIVRYRVQNIITQALTEIDPVKIGNLFDMAISNVKKLKGLGLFSSNSIVSGTIVQALTETNPARIDLLDKAITIAEKISDSNHQSSALGTIAQALTKIDPVRAEGLFNRIIKIAEETSTEQTRSKILSKILLTQVYSKFSIDIVEISKKILFNRDQFLYDLIFIFVNSGDNKKFKSFLIQSAYYVYSGYSVVGLLFPLYKDQSQLLLNKIDEIQII